MSKKISLSEIESKVNKMMNSNLTPSSDSPSSKTPDAMSVSYDSIVKTYLPDNIKAGISKLSVEEKKSFVQSVVDYSNQSRYRIGKICNGKSCPTHLDCPLAKIGEEVVPVDKRCPFELIEVDKVYTKYYNMFVSEFRLDPGLTDIYLRELIVLEVNVQRINEHIAERGLLETSPIFGFPKSEQIVEGKVASPLFDILERLLKRRDAIFKALAITPEAKLKYKTRADSDLTKLLKEFRKRGEDAIRRFKKDDYENGSASAVAEVIKEEGEGHARG